MVSFFLSPHSDDAILSCGGTIHRLRSQGETIIIRTVFSGSPIEPFSPFAKRLHAIWGNPADIYRTRREEDFAANSILGAAVLFGDTPDALYRQDPAGSWLYNAHADLYEELHPDDNELVAHVVEELRISSLPKESTCYAPLAIGNHVDHAIVFAAAIQLRAAGWDVHFYEDYPYARDPDVCNKKFTLITDWAPEDSMFSIESLRAKIAAVKCYYSQIPMLFGDEDVSQVLEKAARVDSTSGAFHERFWVPSEKLRTRNPHNKKLPS